MLETSAKDAALACVGRGWSVFPLRGKLPLVHWKGLQSAAPSLDQVVAWWDQHPDAGIGVVLGAASGVVRLDADSSLGVEKAVELFGELPETAKFTTPNDGTGWLFKYEPGMESCTLWTGAGAHQELRFMSDGSYTVIPPSPHPDGGNYTWIGDPYKVEVASAPPRLKDAVRSAKAARILKELEQELRGSAEQPDKSTVLDALDHLPEHYCENYDTWLQVGMALHSLGEDLLPAWDAWSRGCPHKFEEGVCERRWQGFNGGGGITGRSVLHWAKEAGWKPPRREPFTDTGNAYRIVAAHRDSMRYCHLWEKWLVWDGKRWAVDTTGCAVRNAKRVFEALFDEAMNEFGKASKAARHSDAGGSQLRKKMSGKLLAHAMKSQDRKAIDAALYLAQCELPVDPASLDVDPWLLNCPNGTLNLRTGILQPHSKDDILSKMCPTACEDSPCYRWLQFLEEVFAGRQELISWLQKLFGYCLTGLTTEHVLPILWGGGANGKSTLVSTVMHVLGDDYSGKAPRELLLATRTPAHPTALTTLFGKRLVAAVETGESATLDETTVKELTGNDLISARRMYEDFWTFRPTHKILLATNHRPEVRGTDHAVWRRLKLVPFTVTFKDQDQDKGLGRKLEEEAPGILAWMVRGCIKWREEGLGEPEAVKEATCEYRGEQDRLSEFLSQCYELNRECRVKVSEVLSKYASWCRNNKERELSGRAFGQAMKERGIERDDTRKYYVGIREV